MENILLYSTSYKIIVKISSIFTSWISHSQICIVFVVYIFLKICMLPIFSQLFPNFLKGCMLASMWYLYLWGKRFHGMSWACSMRVFFTWHWVHTVTILFTRYFIVCQFLESLFYESLSIIDLCLIPCKFS